jgi:Peptidase family M1 domain
LRTQFRFPAALFAALFVAGACAPVAEPIIAPVPQGAAGDTAPRPLLQPVPVTQEFQAAIREGTRTATGQPGARYWQQRVRYVIEAELDPRTTLLTGRERVYYRNNSPDTLRVVAVNLYQNLFRGVNAGTEGPLGLNLTRVAFQGQPVPTLTRQQVEGNLVGGRITPGLAAESSLGRIYLPRPIAPGDSAVFEFDWNYRVPPEGAPRTAYEDALGGRVLQVAQWYPQIAVYDDVVGLDVTRYTGQGEFYLDYGDFEYSLTLPAGWLVGGTGTLSNPDQVLAPDVRQRLAQALTTDSITNVVTRANLGRGTVAGQNGRVTWRFSARNEYLWDATRAVIPSPQGGGTQTVAVHSLYRPGAPGWEQSARYGQHSTALLSRQIIPYIYPQITISEGPIYGMEYPMIVFIGKPEAGLPLYEVIAHEVGHEWFPMMVGQDEAAFAWMDEGFTTFHEALAVNDFFPNRQHFEQPRTAYLTLAGRRGEAPLMRHADQMDDLQMGVAAYYKPGTLLRSLRAVLGNEVFDRAMRTYANEWLLKHPYPWDFFNTMERVSGRDLDWFFHPWFFTTGTLDLAVGQVTPGNGQVSVTVRDVGQTVAPAIVTVTTREGATVSDTITADQWLRPANRRSVTVTIPVPGTVQRVEIDPEQIFPDINRRNNVWTGN